MQSCQSKNVHTGTGPINSKGSVSTSNGLAENLPKISSSSATNPKVSCKIESDVVIKPENDKLVDQQKQQNHNNDRSAVKPHDYPSMNLKAHDISPEPARGSTGLQIPLVQHEQAENNNNNSDNHRKRVGKAHQHQITPLSIYQTAFMGMHSFSRD